MSNSETAPESPLAPLSQPVPGRLGMFAGMSFLSGVVPIPFLPGRVLRQMRGALAHEVASRHGVTLTTDARAILADPNSDDKVRAVVRRGAELVARRLLRRLGPLGPISLAMRALEVYALGYLMDRYLREARLEESSRLSGGEAHQLKSLVDTAVLRAFYPSTVTAPLSRGQAQEDLRDEFTRWLDLLLVGTASVPSIVQRRLDGAFDSLVAAPAGWRGD